MSLTACFVTRDEERTLEQALNSIVPIADQVIIADTGSRDRTVAIAARFGALVHPFYWEDDFSTARNFALRQATTDWVFWINPNETLPVAAYPHLRECLCRTDAFAYSVVVQNQVQADRPDAFTETWDYRLFRRHPDVQYGGRLHPNFVTPLAALAAKDGKKVYASGLTLRHHGYTSELNEGKLRWAVRLLERELKDRPGQLSYLIEYGRTLLRLNDPKGHVVLAEAVVQVLPVCQAPSAPNPQVQSLLEYLLTVSHEQSRSRLKKEEARDLALRWFPSSPPLLWTVAADWFKRGDYGQAAQLLERLVALGQSNAYDKSEAFDPRIIGEDAVMNLGACYWRLNDLPKAEACFRRLLVSRTFQDQAKKNLALVRNTQQQPETSFYSAFLGGGE
ncbi:MAG: glycosyltransferase [Gemmataceae bacterium]